MMLWINDRLLRLQADGSIDEPFTNEPRYTGVDHALRTGATIQEAMPGARQMVERLNEGGWSVLADAGETDPEDWPVITPDNVVWECAQVDEMTLRCVRGQERGWIFVILGNGVDWLCDYTVNLEAWVDG